MGATSERNLSDLASRINKAHRRAESGSRETLVGAIEAGKLLIQAQNTIEPGKWIAWVKSSLELSVRTTQKYKRLAEHASDLGENAPFTAHLGVDQALEFIADNVDSNGDKEVSDEELAATIQEEETEALQRETVREKREGECDENRKRLRKMKTLRNLAGYFGKMEYSPAPEEMVEIREAIVLLARWAGVGVAEEVAA